jgi:indole-3-glycerol phosphate synthase
MSGDFLAAMASASRARVRAAQAQRPRQELERALAGAAPAPALRLHPSGFDLIAELKLRSPAQGRLRSSDEDIGARVRAYAAGGAAAVSVLTEPTRFDGELAHLQGAAAALAGSGVPAMRKDFLVDPYQVLEARLAGAGGVLVILRMLPVAHTEALIACARECGLFVLLEAFDADDIGLMRTLIERHGSATRLLGGVNCRDLTSLQVVPARLLELAPLLPDTVARVAESGVTDAAQARAVAAAGYELALVGSALMQGDAPSSLAGALLTAGRAARDA